MVETKYILTQTNDTWILTSVYILLIVLFMMLYFFSFFATNTDEDIVVSKAQFDILTRKAKLPEGPGASSLATKEGYIDPSNLTLADLDLFVGYEECPEGECAIDLATGVKRCPENQNVRVVYNRGYESCSQKFFCTSDKLPFAVLTSGETDNFGVCEPGDICRCTDRVVCPKYVTSAINLRNGSAYSSTPGDSDYFFDQTVADSEIVTGYESIEIPASLAGKRFCAINPSFTDRINGGCDFSNTDSDILGCLTSNDFYKIESLEFKEDYDGSNFTFGYQNTPENDYKTYLYQSDVNLKGTFKPSQGYAIRKSGDDVLGLISYDGFSGNIETIGDQDSNLITNLASYSLSGDTVTQDLGTQSFGEGLGNDSSLDFLEIIYTGCRNLGSGTNVSNRSMLLCTQSTEQPCLEGQLSYVPTEKRACDFCQDTTTTLGYIDLEERDVNPSGRLFSLNDPENVLMSCTVGPGCNGDYNASFCKSDGSCDDAIASFKDNYKGEYDANGVRNVWVANKNNTPLAGKITFKTIGTDGEGGFKFMNAGLVDIQPGDYFSYSRLSLSKVVSETVTVENGMVIKLGTVDGILAGYNIYYLDFKGTVVSIDDDASTITVNNINASPPETIPQYATVRFLSILVEDDDGLKYGRFWKGEDGSIFPSTILNPGKEISRIASTPDSLYIYKQFGYNGINYNTYSSVSYIPDNDTYTIQRRYSSSSRWAYWFSDSELLQPPQASISIPLVQSLDYSTKGKLNPVIFSSPDADFKKELSFYYPVWDEEKNRQICVQCKPNLITYTKIAPKGEFRDTNRLESVVIQYSGKDFSQYVIYPTLTKNSQTGWKWLIQDGGLKYAYSVFSTIDGEASSTRRIVLNDINPNIPLSSDVPDDYYTNNPYYLVDSYGALRKRFRMIDNDNPPSSIDPVILKKKLQLNYEATNVLEDRFVPYTFQGEVLEPTPSTFVYDRNSDTYVNNTLNLENYFMGKTYYHEDKQLYLNSDVRITRVEIVNGQQVIFTNSIQGENFPAESLGGLEIVLQVVSEKDTLQFRFETSPDRYSNISVFPSAITKGRVTDIDFIRTGSAYQNETFVITNVPRLVISKYRNVE